MTPDEGNRPGVDTVAALVAVTSQARAEFGVACFWNAPKLADPVENARMVVDRLRRYGGRKGWKAAARIVDAIARAGDRVEPPEPP